MAGIRSQRERERERERERWENMTSHKIVQGSATKIFSSLVKWMSKLQKSTTRISFV
jgi:hypothetical protein